MSTVSPSREFSPSGVFPSLSEADLRSYLQPTAVAAQPKLQSWLPGTISGWVFVCCLFVIGAVSTYDTWLAYQYREVIESLERNLICLALIELDPDTLRFFIAGKFLGTFTALMGLTLVWKWARRIGLTSAIGVAAFQLALFCYLTMGDFEVVLPSSVQSAIYSMLGG